MCRTIDTVEVCPICGNTKRITYAEIRCESNIYPFGDMPYLSLMICKSYRELKNTIVAGSICKGCNRKEMASFSRDLNSASVSDPSSGDELQELRDTTAESTKLSDLTEDISEDDHDPGNDNDLTISEISELNNAEMDIIIDILDLEIDQEYVLVKRDNLQKLVDAAAEPTKLSDLTEVISEDDHDPEDNNDLAISEISELDDAEVDMIFDSTEGTTKYDGEVFDSNEDDFLVEEYRCSTPELETRVRQLKREARALKWH